MIKRNLILAVRSLMIHRKYALTNILGLSLGLTCFILISIWVQDELSYDSFHRDADNVHIVLRNENEKRAAVSSRLLASAIKEEIPEISEATSFMELPETLSALFQYKEKSFNESMALADNQFFKVFSFPLIKGEATSLFDEPNSVLITERVSKKYFGNEDAIGKTLSITMLGQNNLIKVSGVMRDIPQQSHIQSELILPIEFMQNFGIQWDAWNDHSARTYIRTSGDSSPRRLGDKILACKQGHYSEANVSYSLLPITKIHLHAGDVEYLSASGDIKYVYIFSAIAIIILLIACMNYINLSNALSLKRSKEIGIKKALGSNRWQVIQQYFIETVVLVLIALFCSILLVQICLPLLNYLSTKTLTVPFTSLQFIFTLLTIVLVTSIISGIYPAVFMSGFQPIKVLKGKFISSPRSISIRKGLVVFQFVLSLLIIIGTITIVNQLRFVQNTNLGYDNEHVVCAQIKGDVSNRYEAFKNEILHSGHVLNVTLSGNMEINAMTKTTSVDWPEKQSEFMLWVLHVDDDFADTYGINMNDGRFYSSELASDMTSGFVINKTAAKEMEFDNPIGQDLTIWGRKGTIIGVTDDFHFNSLHNKIEPLIFFIPEPQDVIHRCTTLSMRIKPNSMARSLESIEATWASFFPSENFDYYFIDDQLKTNYVAEQRMGTLFKYFSFLVIFIACLGLYGLTAFTIEQKIKVIGVYKVFGATIVDLMQNFSKAYVLWILIANVMAIPIAYYAMSKWLENFAYKTGLHWWIFVQAGLLVMGLALLTVAWQVWRAASRNPVESLRYE